MRMHAFRPAPVLGLAIALGLGPAGCGRGRAPATSTGAEPAAAHGAARKPALQDDLVVHTNEPFWQARMAGEHLLLAGIEGERTLDIVRSALAEGTRTVVATDASGTIEIRAGAGPCQDSMAATEFPFTATLAIDGGEPVSGCARPAWMPAPREPR